MQEMTSHAANRDSTKEQEKWQGYLRTDYAQMQDELEQIEQAQVSASDSIQALRIHIDSELESTIQELGELQAQLPKEQSASLFQQCADNALNAVVGHFELHSHTKAQSFLQASQHSGKMAAHEAIGIVLRDLIQEMMIETQVLMKEFGNESCKEIFTRFKNRLLAVWEKLQAKWKHILESSAMSFFSNMVVYVVNVVFQALKDMAKIIRAGFNSLYQAIKILVNPPKDMPKDEVMREAAKVLVSGLIAATTMLGAAALGEMIKTTFPFLALPLPFTEGETIASAVGLCLTAALGAVLSTIAIYYIDKWASDSKESRLQLQIMGKSGEIVQLKTAQSWFVLHDAWQFTLGITQSTINKINEAQEAIAKSSQETKESFDDLDSTMAKLRAFRAQHN